MGGLGQLGIQLGRPNVLKKKRQSHAAVQDAKRVWRGRSEWSGWLSQARAWKGKAAFRAALENPKCVVGPMSHWQVEGLWFCTI
jgi:hypothetical protein